MGSIYEVRSGEDYKVHPALRTHPGGWNQAANRWRRAPSTVRVTSMLPRVAFE